MSFASKSQPPERDDDNPIDQAETKYQLILRMMVQRGYSPEEAADAAAAQIEREFDQHVQRNVQEKHSGDVTLDRQVEDIKRGNPRRNVVKTYQKARYVPIKCEVCGKVFYTSRRDAKTCSPACRQRLSRKDK
jgi:hypothetical protein